MTSEEQFISDGWYVLQNIHERSLYTAKDEPIRYEVDYTHYRNDDVPSVDDEIAVIYKLEEFGIIAITRKSFRTGKALL